MSNFLSFQGNSGVTFKTFTAGTSGDDYPTATTYVLDKSASTNSVLVSVGGVLQKPGTDYTVSGATLTTTSTVTSGIVIDTYIIHDAGNAPVIEDNSIVTAKIADNQVTTAKIADDQVTLAKIASGTDGELITWDASGNPAAVAVGTATHVLTSNGAGAAPTFQAAGGGGWEYVSVATGSGATKSFTNMASGYDYLYVMENITGDTQYAAVYANLGVAGPSYRSSGYIGQICGLNASGNTNSTEPTTAIYCVDNTQEGMGNPSSQTDSRLANFMLELRNPAGSTETEWWGTGLIYGGTPSVQTKWSGGWYNGAAEAHTCIQFDMNSGSFTGGTWMQYRRARS